MFKVYHSNHLEVLKGLLQSEISRKPLASPFATEQILVQSPGMAQWLKIELAKQQGIVANIDFPLPGTFIWNMFTKVLDDVPTTSSFNKEAMTWKIIKLLPKLLEDNDFAELKRYLDYDDQGQKCFQLAGKIADIFDQYLVYRPKWIQRWENEQPITELSGILPWQEKLWRALYDHSIELGQSPYHRANLDDNFIDTLTAHSSKPKGLAELERVFVFGISALPPSYLAALTALSKHIDVHYMFSNPCRGYWGDIRDLRYLTRRKVANQAESQTLVNFDQQDLAEVGNSLLASMGKMGRDNLLLINDVPSEVIDQGFVEIERDSLLHHIQADILDLIEPGDIEQTEHSRSKQQIATTDDSISVEVCHSPMREVEVLHDRLLGMLEDPELSPRDIVVMVADINEYSPVIQAVFGSAGKDRYIPFAISDRSAEQESPIISTFLHLLSLPNSRCNANQLLEILQVPAVLRRFELDDQQFEQIKFWIAESGIRWGLNEATAEQFALPRQAQNTWEFGLNRMLLGFAMPSDAGFFAGIAPYDEIQGLTANTLGKLAQFFNLLLTAQQTLSNARTGQEWLSLLTQLLDDMFALSMEEEPAGHMIRTKLAGWVNQLEEAEFSQKLSLSVVQEYLQNALSVVGVSQRFLAGQVNFCTLMPMRSIPFKVVCLLGMNEGAYPRSVAPIGFDLMVGRTKLGDRSRREDDRYLFLEALQAAQQRLYISYVGRSILDNSEKAPSVLVTELLQYCTQGYCLQGDTELTEQQSAQRLRAKLCYQNALVPFSPQAFLTKPSYAAQWLAVANGERLATESFIDSAGLALNVGTDTVELAELQRFYRLPVRYFFNRRLSVVFDDQHNSIDENEPFALDNLARYQLRDGLLSYLLAHAADVDCVADFYQNQRAAGQLPVNYFGELELDAERDNVILLANTLLPYLQEPAKVREVDLTLSSCVGEVRLQGWLKHGFQLGQVLYRSGKIRSQDRMSAWLEHLCSCAMGYGVETYLIGRNDKKGIAHFCYGVVDKAQAKRLLTTYLDYYFLGLQQPLGYFPKTALAGLEVLIDPKQQAKPADEVVAKAKEAMSKVFENGYLVEGEKQDPYISRLWPQASDVLYEEVIMHAKQLLLPALEAVKE